MSIMEIGNPKSIGVILGDGDIRTRFQIAETKGEDGAYHIIYLMEMEELERKLGVGNKITESVGRSARDHSVSLLFRSTRDIDEIISRLQNMKQAIIERGYAQ